MPLQNEPATDREAIPVLAPLRRVRDDVSPVRKVFSTTTVSRIQSQYFASFYLLPNILVIATLPFSGWPSLLEWSLFAIGWFASCLGISVGFHRLFTHKAFKTFAWMETALAILGMTAAQGPLIFWVGVHRRHHEHSDAVGDPHSPLGNPPRIRDSWRSWLRGMGHAHMGWIRQHDLPNALFYARDLYRKPWLITVNRWYFAWVGLSLLLPGAIVGIVEQRWDSVLHAVLFCGLLRLVLVNHAVWSINSLCHGIGYRRYATSDLSTNCWWLAIPTVGEAWHNNHHHRQASAIFGHAWWEIDLGGWLIRLMQRLGLAWDVRTPGDFLWRSQAIPGPFSTTVSPRPSLCDNETDDNSTQGFELL